MEAVKSGIITENGNAAGKKRSLDSDFYPGQPRHTIHQLTREPLLTHDEEIDLSQQIANARIARTRLAMGQTGALERSLLLSVIQKGSKAQERMVLSNTRLVVSVAARYASRDFPLLDLIQEGVIGLIRSLHKYDPDRGTRFSTYATWWIRQAISRHIEKGNRMIRIPIHINHRMRRVMRTAHDLAQKLGRDPLDAEIGDELGLDTEAIHEAKIVSSPVISLEIPQDDEGDRVLLDMYKDGKTHSPEEVVDQSLLREQIFDAIRSLSEREATILMLRFGLDDGPEHTLQEVGDRYGLTRERIRQIQDRALDDLRSKLNELYEGQAE